MYLEQKKSITAINLSSFDPGELFVVNNQVYLKLAGRPLQAINLHDNTLNSWDTDLTVQAADHDPLVWWLA